MAPVKSIPGDRYILGRALGSGGSSCVFEAEDRRLGLTRAAKWIPAREKDTGDPALPEATLLAGFSHPALPRVLDCIPDEEGSWILMERVRGETLAERIAREGSLATGTCLEIGIGLCGVLSYLHGIQPTPVIHGDIKPSNLIWDTREGLKLIDFGASPSMERGDGENTGVMGTYGYASPEAARGEAILPQSDLYAAGRTLQHLLTGIRPGIREEEGDRAMTDDRSGLAQNLCRIIQKCTAHDPWERYETAEALRCALEACREKRTESRLKRRRLGRSREKVRLFHRMTIAIPGCPAFACAMAAGAARQIPARILLADLDWFWGETAFYLRGTLRDQQKQGGSAGLLSMFLYPRNGRLTSDHLSDGGRVPDARNICFASGLRDNLDFLEIPPAERLSESPAEGRLRELIRQLQAAYDLVILSLPVLSQGRPVLEAIRASDRCILAAGPGALSFARLCLAAGYLGREIPYSEEKTGYIYYGDDGKSAALWRRMETAQPPGCRKIGEIYCLKEREPDRTIRRGVCPDREMDGPIGRLFREIGLYREGCA